MRSLSFISIGLFLFFCCALSAKAELSEKPYSNSAHGSSEYGVNRLGSSPHVKGNCSHCHEQHASIGGSINTPASFSLFMPGYTSPTVNICVTCHDGSTIVAQAAITNHSYSYRAGGLTFDFVDNIKDAFDPSNMASTHNLDDMQAFLKTTGSSIWGFSATNPQPCTACHNPHAVQGDPANSPAGKKDSTARGYPISRPSDYSETTGWELWGDEAGEKMSDYVGAMTYQAPYYFGSIVYEPEGNTQADGTNLTDFNSFCTDCHNSTYNISSTRLTRDVRKFNWDLEVHGAVAAEKLSGKNQQEMRLPYLDDNQGDYILSCLDCHESHGSFNPFLIRGSVNGSAVVLDQAGTTDWGQLCSKCHVATEDLKSFHHSVNTSFACTDCHVDANNKGAGIHPCTNCHYHGSSAGTFKTF